MEEERRLAYVGMTRARQRLYLSHAWQRATRRGPGTRLDGRALAVPDRDPRRAHERPRLGARPEDGEGYEASDDLNLVFGRGATRFGRPICPGAGAFREGSGRPGAPGAGEAFRPSRDLAARREAFAGGARSGTFGRRVEAWDDDGASVAGRRWGRCRRGDRPRRWCHPGRARHRPSHRPGRAPLPGRRPRAPRALG